MGNSNGGNRTNVDRELGRMDSEYNPFIQNAMGSGDFGRADAGRLRDETLAGYRGGAGYNPQSFSGMGGGGSSYGGDVGWNNSALGDTGSARGTYENFSQTGGVDATALRQRATAQIPSFYAAYKSNAARRANTQGGYSPGFDAQQAEIGRQAGREGFNASRQVEGDIADKVMQGRLAGASGLMGLGGMETQNNQFNTSGQFSAAEGNANRRQSAGQFDAGMGLDWARLGQQDRQFGADFNEGNRRFNSQGIAGMYGMDQDAYNNNQANYLRGIQGRQGAAQNLIFNRTEPTSRFDSLVSGLSGLGGSLLGNFGGSRRPQTSANSWYNTEGGG